jgi:anti-sigma regulatory factor (Ser/Thr protein kinase)
MRRLLQDAARGRRSKGDGGQLRGALRRAGVRVRGAEPTWICEFSFPAYASQIPEARRRVRETAVACGMVDRSLFELVLAAGEALDNAVLHGSPNRGHDVIGVRVGLKSFAVAVEITDEGPGLNGYRRRRPGTDEATGRGIPFMRCLVDDLSLDDTGAGMRVRLVKLIP